MKKFWICLALCMLAPMKGISYALPLPDSAGIFPQPPPGISFGGIPYGSISGQLSSYYGEHDPILFSLNEQVVEEVQYV